MTLTRPADDAAAQAAVDVLRAGGLVVVPVDVGYCVVADAFDEDATRRLRAVDEELVLLVRGPRQVVGVAEAVPEPAQRLMAAFWPGPLAITVQAAHGVALQLGGDERAVTVRMPAGELLAALLVAVGPLACGTPAQTADGALVGGLDVGLVIDDGPHAVRRVAVVDVTRPDVWLTEPGGVPAEEIEAVLRGTIGWGGTPGT